ncbi:hypothetical protein Ga0100231_015520 [Opitutaceae bacterium TAV4]|nr:hypothetical protein Ga0100231_015520 [Opitutaceae bacterium TAV4]RRJ99668.1 hypothetical protein Ga0100230_016350 [Opitutaceae bacterium TAV3]
MKPLRGEVEEYYRRYDNDTFCIFLAKALRGLGVIFIICFLMWPLGLYQSRNWPSTSTSEIRRDNGDSMYFDMFGYWVDGQAYFFRSHYFGGNPPAIFGKLGLSRPDSVYYDPAEPSTHVATKMPSWMTILLPFLAIVSFQYARKVYSAASPGAEERAHPYDPKKDRA